ncbi:MAG: ROK family protein [Prevotella sp.]
MDKEKIKDRVVGVDISLNQTTIAVVDIRGNIIARTSFRTEDYPNISDFITTLAERIVMLAEDNGGFMEIRSVGISSPSGNFKTGCMENSPNMPWKGVIPFAAMLRDRLGIAVALGNDSHVMALGEHVYGSAHGMRDFVLMTLGHGFGNAVFSRNKVLLGSHGFAGEYGHSCVVTNGRLCNCGLHGCLEAYCAEKGVLQTAREVIEEFSSESTLMTIYDKLTPKDITECCNRGDKLAIETYRRTGQVLGRAMANIAAMLDPQAIIVTGGISKAGEWLMQPARESFDQHVFRNIKGKVKILNSSLDSRERDVLGASALAWEVEEYSLFK